MKSSTFCLKDIIKQVHICLSCLEPLESYNKWVQNWIWAFLVLLLVACCHTVKDVFLLIDVLGGHWEATFWWSNRNKIPNPKYGIVKPETQNVCYIVFSAFKNDVYYSQCAEELHIFQKYWQIFEKFNILFKRYNKTSSYLFILSGTSWILYQVGTKLNLGILSTSVSCMLSYCQRSFPANRCIGRSLRGHILVIK